MTEPAARGRAAMRLSPPLSFAEPFDRAFEAGFGMGQKPVAADVVMATLPPDCDDLEPRRTHRGNSVKVLAEQCRSAEIRPFLNAPLDPGRTRELADWMRAVYGHCDAHRAVSLVCTRRGELTEHVVASPECPCSHGAIAMTHKCVGLLALAAWVAVLPALADSEPFFTRYSAFRIVDRGHHLQELVSDGREQNWHPDWPVPGTENWRLVVESTIPWRLDTDVVVLERLEVSNACWGRYQFVVVPREGLPWTTPASESCSFGPMAMRVSHEEIELDTAVRRPDLSHVTLRFDGETMHEVEVPRDDSGAEMARAGPDVARWVDTSSSRILDEPSERLRFGTIMRRNDLYELVRNTYLSLFHTVLVDDVLIAWGCRPHQCGDVQGGIAIEVATGRPYAVTCSREHGVKVFGGALSDLPEAFSKVGALKCAFWNGGDD